jgi:chemotaxis protein methyltransferase CheR
MVLADRFGLDGWEVIGSDISTRVLDQAGRGQYSMERAREIPSRFLSRYCLKGVGAQAGTFIVAPPLTERVRFMQINLNQPLPGIGAFNVVFLRNVMIYFDLPTKEAVVRRIVPLLKPGGYLFVGHSESLNGVTSALKPVLPAVYQLP